MTTLVLDNRALELRLDGAALAFYEAGARRGSLPLKLLDRVVIQDDAQDMPHPRADRGHLGVKTLVHPSQQVLLLAGLEPDAPEIIESGIGGRLRRPVVGSCGLMIASSAAQGTTFSISAKKRSRGVRFFFRSKASEAKVVGFMVAVQSMTSVFYRP